MQRLKEIEDKIYQCEVMAMKIKAMNFANLQTFDYVSKNYEVGEIYNVNNFGYTIITSKTEKQIDFVVIMKSNNIWEHHWQDVDKQLEIKQGVYLDLYTGKEFTDTFKVKAFEPSYFKSIGSQDLIIKGKIWKN